MSRKKKEKGKDIFFEQYKVFKNNIDMYQTSIDILGSHAKKYDTKHIKSLVTSLESIPKNKKKKDELLVTGQLLEEILSFTKKHPNQTRLFTKNTVVSIVSSLEHLIMGIYRNFLLMNPKELSIENQSLTFKELSQIGNVKDAEKYLINKEVENIIRHKGLKNTIEILLAKVNNKFKEDLKFFSQVEKLIKIRNLITHAEGLVDKEYLKKYGDNNVKLEDKLVISISELKEYLLLTYFFGGYLLQEFQLFSNNKIETENYIINNVMHDLLKRENYIFLRDIYDLRNKLNLDELTRKMIVINYCVGLKKQDRDVTHISKVLEKEDWSACSEKFTMSLMSLKNKNKEFYIQLEKLVKIKEISFDELSEWVIFSLYSKKKKFKEILKIAKDISVKN